MKHLGTKTLETDRLVLRRFTMEDAGDMYRNWASDPEVTKYLTWPPHGSQEVSAAVLKQWIADYEKPDCYQWAILWKETNEVMGSISVVHSDDRIRLAHIGYCIGRAWWGRGIMTEALARVMDFLFEEVGMERIESTHDVNNPASGAVMKKCGMVYEGTHRKSGYNNQGICDMCWYGKLR